MSLPVHLVESLAEAVPGAVVTVAGDEAHHAVAVRRLKVGERVVLTDGRGGRILGEVSGMGKRRLEVDVCEVETLPAPQPSCTVVQAIPKGDRGERAVEMMTEIGCARIVPWAAERCVAVWRGDRAAKGVAKWRSAAREAAKQARRAWFPVVADLHATPEILGLVAEADLAVVLHEGAERPLSSVDPPVGGEVLLVVGPEGGLSADEIGSLTGAGAIEVRLGAEVLRTSTAGVAAVAAVLSRTARWR